MVTVLLKESHFKGMVHALSSGKPEYKLGLRVQGIGIGPNYSYIECEDSLGRCYIFECRK